MEVKDLRINTNNNEIKSFKWKVSTLGEPFEYQEKFVDENNRLLEFDRFGEIFIDCLWAKSSLNKQEIFDSYEKSTLLDLAEYIGVDYYENEASVIDIFFEALKKLTKSYYDNAYYCLIHHKTRPSQKAQSLYREICREMDIHEDIPFSAEVCLKYLQSKLHSMNELYCSNLEVIHSDVLHSLADEINKNVQTSQICRDCLTDREKQQEREYARCVAVYVFDEENAYRGYLTFSGFLDCNDLDILNAVCNTSTPKLELIETISKIATSLRLELVTTNPNIRLFGIENNRLQEIANLGKEINYRNIPLSNNAKLDIERIKGDYSCCERKIFTKFDSEYRHGTLFVKFAPCEKCQLATLYELQIQHLFSLVPRLKLKNNTQTKKGKIENEPHKELFG